MIVITGGPCGGKSSALKRIKSEFTERGYTVLTVSETATELIGGGVAPWTCKPFGAYQRCQMRLQNTKEETFLAAAETMEAERILIVCDRALFDSLAYMGDERFEAGLALNGLERAELLKRYDAVFHLVTAAKGAEAYYTTANNSARKESVAEAAELDGCTLAAWSEHPYHRVIDNSTDFPGKLDRLIDGIAQFLAEKEAGEI